MCALRVSYVYLICMACMSGSMALFAFHKLRLPHVCLVSAACMSGSKALLRYHRLRHHMCALYACIAAVHGWHAWRACTPGYTQCTQADMQCMPTLYTHSKAVSIMHVSPAQIPRLAPADGSRVLPKSHFPCGRCDRSWPRWRESETTDLCQRPRPPAPRLRTGKSALPG